MLYLDGIPPDIESYNPIDPIIQDGKRRYGGSNRPQKRESGDWNDINFHPPVVTFLFDWLFDPSNYIFVDALLYLPFKKRKLNILDSCCGKGNLGEYFLKNGLNVEFVDNNPKYDQDIWLLDSQYYDNATYHCMDVLDISEHCKFDLILCNPPWQPIHYTHSIFLKMRKLLKSNGVLYFFASAFYCNTGVKRMKDFENCQRLDLPRYTFYKALRKRNPKSSGLLDPVVMVYKPEKLLYYRFPSIPIPSTVCKE